MCKIFKRCFVTKKKKRDFTNRLTVVEFKNKLKPINTDLSKYSSIAKEKHRYGQFLILVI
mgnify:CR=1 FL=1